MLAFPFLTMSFQTSDRDLICLSSPLSWWKLGFAFSLGKTPTFTIAQRTISAEGPLPCIFPLSRSRPDTGQHRAVSGHAPQALHPQPRPWSLVAGDRLYRRERAEEGDEEKEERENEPA